MTIKVEQETLIALQAPSWSISNDNEAYQLRVVNRKQPSRSLLYQDEDFDSPVVEKQQLQHSLSSDDEDSVFTSSTASFSDSDSDFDRRVSFADDLVSEVWTRPYTDKEDISDLYYSNEETQRFRQEYRMERKLLSTLTSEFSIDPDSVDKDDLSALLASTCSPPSIRHRNGISRVVVLHNDRLETFCASSPVEESSPCCDQSSNTDDVPSDFFDTPEFWSGSITWW